MKKLCVFIIVLISINKLTISQDYWQHVHTNDTNHIWSIEISKAGTIYYGSSNGLYISNDEGETWDFKYLDKYAYMYEIAFDIDSNLICVARNKLYKYKIAEDEWEFLFEPEGPPYNIHALLVDGPEIFAGDIGHNLYHFDGETWEKLEGQPVIGIEDIVKDTLGRLFTCGTSFSTNNGSVAQSLDNGQTWTLIGLENSYLATLAIDSYNRLYAGSTGNHVNGIGGLYRYDRESGTWDTLRLYHGVQSMLLNEEDSLYIGQYSIGGPPAGAFMSPDYGETWYDISSGLPEGNSHKNVMELSLGPQGHLYCIIQNENSIYKSTNTTTVGINNADHPEEFEIQTFPNPASSQLFILFNNNIQSACNISIYNISGETVWSEPNVIISNEKLILNLPGQLPGGIYIIKFEFDHFSEFRKIIKY